MSAAATATDKQSSNCEFSLIFQLSPFTLLEFRIHSISFPDSSPHMRDLADMEEHSEKGMEKMGLIVGITRIVPSRNSSINSLLFSLAKHTFQFSFLHILKAKSFLLVLSLSSLLEKKDVASQPNSYSLNYKDAASQPDSKTTEARLFLIMSSRSKIILDHASEMKYLALPPLQHRFFSHQFQIP